MTLRASSFIRIPVSMGVVAAITFLYSRLVEVNPTTVALTYLVAVMGLSTVWGIAEATIASLTAVLCFNFFFLPPIGTFTIADPQNWVALVAFLVTAIVTSQLSGRARQRTVDAIARQSDLERLYALSRALLLSERLDRLSIPAGIARHIARAFELDAVALYDHRAGLVTRAGPHEISNVEDRLREVARQGIAMRDGSGATVTSIQLGGQPIGSLAILGGTLSDTVLQSIANLAAIALEQARGQDAAARAEAARESGELRAAMLDALAHEFKTPLTSIKAAASDLRSTPTLQARESELAAIVVEESARLQGLITDAVQMLRLDAGGFAIHRERHALVGLVASALADQRARLDGHLVVNRVPDDLLVEVDTELLRLALRQLLDNAAKYSPPTSAIEIGATEDKNVTIRVHNSGSVIPDAERAHIFDRFYRGSNARTVPGTGIGLAVVRQIAEAHSGQVSVESSASAGTTFTICLPHGGDRA